MNAQRRTLKMLTILKARAAFILIVFATLISACGYDYRMTGTWKFKGESGYGECTLSINGEYGEVGVNEEEVPVKIRQVSEKCLGLPSVHLEGSYNRESGHFIFREYDSNYDFWHQGQKISLVGDLSDDARSAHGRAQRDTNLVEFSDEITSRATSSTFTAFRF